MSATPGVVETTRMGAMAKTTQPTLERPNIQAATREDAPSRRMASVRECDHAAARPSITNEYHTWSALGAIQRKANAAANCE